MECWNIVRAPVFLTLGILGNLVHLFEIYQPLGIVVPLQY